MLSGFDKGASKAETKQQVWWLKMQLIITFIKFNSSEKNLSNKVCLSQNDFLMWSFVSAATAFWNAVLLITFAAMTNHFSCNDKTALIAITNSFSYTLNAVLVHAFHT